MSEISSGIEYLIPSIIVLLQVDEKTVVSLAGYNKF